MSQVYKVAIHYDNVCGQVEYDVEEKKIHVFLDHEEKKQIVEKYLNQEHTINEAKDLRNFEPKTAYPADSLEFLQLCLTRMWNKTEVFVDWSRPVH